MTEYAVDMENINKSFSGVSVLRNVRFQLQKGTIHALLGENGAGKTTLMKILTAEYTKDSGRISINGIDVNFQHPIDAISAGVAFVHQELSILTNLTVGENIYLGNRPKRMKMIDWKSMNRNANQILSELEVDFEASTPAELLSVGQLQIVEIAKALAQNASIFIMDEPTSSLSSDESNRLFRMMKRLTDKGNSFIYISHRLAEVLEISNQITVLRDGEYVDTVEADGVDPETLSELIIGRKVPSGLLSASSRVSETPVLSARGIVAKKVRNVDLDIYSGEIASLYGLVGSGRTELVRAMIGIDARQEGSVAINGKPLPTVYRKALKNGVGFLSEERKTQAVFTELALHHNLTITNLKRIQKAGLISYRRERKITAQYIEELRIKGRSGSMLSGLSGGTQQKVALAKWLYANSRILILDEPTKGIDVASRFEIYQILNKLAGEGLAILVISSDVEEVLRISNRVLVMRDGSITAEFDRSILTEEVILSHAIGSK